MRSRRPASGTKSVCRPRPYRQRSLQTVSGRERPQSEVENLDTAVRGDKHILGLEVAVDDPLLVRRREATSDGDGVADRLAHGNGSCDQSFPQRLNRLWNYRAPS